MPTLIEAGVPGFDVLAWVAFTAPRGMPAELVSKINGDVRRVVQEPQLRQRIINAGLEPIDGGTPEVVAAFYRKEVVRWRQRVEDAQLKVE